jgi:hypothetical protein
MSASQRVVNFFDSVPTLIRGIAVYLARTGLRPARDELYFSIRQQLPDLDGFITRVEGADSQSESKEEIEKSGQNRFS